MGPRTAVGFNSNLNREGWGGGRISASEPRRIRRIRRLPHRERLFESLDDG